MDDSRAETPTRRPSPVPAYLLVLLAACIAGVVILHRAAGAWHEASVARAYPADVRGQLVFAVLFNAGIAGALVLSLAGEVAGSAIRRLRRRPVLPARPACALLLLVVFALLNHLANPFVHDVVRALRGALG